MINARRQVIANITRMENKLIDQQREMHAHKKYLATIMGDKRVMLIFSLLPPFIVGWKSARVGGRQSIIKFIKSVSFSTITNLMRLF